MLFSPQMPLPLEPRQADRLERFVPGPNGACLAAVEAVLSHSDNSLFLSGPAGSGKSFLLNAACVEARDAGLTAFYLGLWGLEDTAAASLQGLESMDLVCLDDLHLLAGRAAWEEGLFHLINRLKARKGRMIVASRFRLSQLELTLPDLASRLAGGVRLELEPLNDDDKGRVLEQRSGTLGIDLPPDVRDYLLRRGSRNLHTLVGVLDQIQQSAFREKRKVTVPLARSILQQASEQ